MKNTQTIKPPRDHRAGSAIAIVVIFTAVLSLLAGGILNQATTQSRINHDYRLMMQARYANLSVLEVVADQIKQQSKSFGMPGVGESFAYSIPNYIDTFFDGALRSNIDIDSTKTEVVVGRRPVDSQKYIDPNNPLYISDDLMGMVITSSEIPIYAKTTLVSDSGKEITVYGKMILDNRESSLFSYAAFFNMNLPAFAGGDMIFNGRVHSNGDITISSDKSDARQVFFDTATMAGGFFDDAFFSYDNQGKTMFFIGGTEFRTNMETGFTYTDGGGTNYTASAFETGGVNFASLQSGSGTEANSLNHFYSPDINFYDLALSNFNGYLKTGVHGVSERKPPGMDDYTFKPKSTDPDFVNTAYQIIQPVRKSNDPRLTPPPTTDPDYATKVAAYQAEKQREQSKFSYRSGLIIEVDGTMIEKTDSKNGSTFTYKTLDPGTVSFEFYRYERDANKNIVYDSATGDPKKIPLGTPSDLVDLDPYEVDPTDPDQLVSGMRDNRRERSLNLVKLDVGRLKELVDNYAGATGDKFDSDGDGSSLTSGWWNGGVYVQFPYDEVNPRTNSSGPAADGVQPAIDGYGLYIHNGKELPNNGLTIATNNSVYLAGHYNADGVVDSDSTTTPETGEAAASIVADSVTLLSENWEANENWKRSVENKNPKKRPAVDTEYSVAIITGQVPGGKKVEGFTQDNDTIANFLRLHEDWKEGKRHFYLRGSVVALFESEVARQYLPGHSDIYRFPGRNFGYNMLFDTQQPPLAPHTATAREGGHRILTKTEFETEVSAL